VVKSLETTSLAEARHRMREPLSEYDDKIAAAKGMVSPAADPNPPKLTRDAIDRAVRSWLKGREEEERANGYGWESSDASERSYDFGFYAAEVDRKDGPGSPPAMMTQWVAEHIAELNNWNFSEAPQLRTFLLQRVARGQRELSRRLSAQVSGAVPAQPDELFAKELFERDTLRGSSKLTTLLNAYSEEAKLKPATLKAWRQCLSHLIKHLGHDDAAQVTEFDLVAWKEALLRERNKAGATRSARTVRDKYLAAAKSIFGWARRNHKIATNPAELLSLKVKPKQSKRRVKGLDDREAGIILRAAKAVAPSEKFPMQAFARRWVPWLCAYTGARVGEITQLRSQDVVQIDGVWCIYITPEAGTVKTEKPRYVPIHPHLIEEGFLNAIEERVGPLFFDPMKHRGGGNGNPQSKKVAERLAKWVRELGVDDPEVQPNHGWRHRFKTQARAAKIEYELREHLQGHAVRTDGADYGDQPMAIKFDAIASMPRYL
jgi:integrase